MSLSEKQSEIIEAFSSTSRYLDDLLNIDNKYFYDLISQNYPSALQLNIAHSYETEAPFSLLAFVYFRWVISCKKKNMINAMIFLMRL